MRKIIGLMTLALAMMVGVSCEKDDTTDMGGIEQPQTKLLSTSKLSIDADGKDEVIDVVCDLAWTVTSDKIWCRTDKAVGFKNGSFAITIDPNTEYGPRVAKIKFVVGADEITEYITITQASASYTLPTTLAIIKDAPTKLYIPAQGDWSASFEQVDSYPYDWIDLTKKSGTGSEYITITTNDNLTASSSMNLVLNYDGGEKRIKLTASMGMTAPTIAFDDDGMLEWEKVVGADSYFVYAYTTGTEQAVATYQINDTDIVSYDISQMPEFTKGHESFYIGNVDIVLVADNSVSSQNVKSNKLTTHSHFAGGNGANGTPYTIANARHLNSIRQVADVAYFKQTAEISLAHYTSFAPIKDFAGHYNGDNNKITNLTATGLDNLGLFAKLIGTGTLSNMIIEGANITCTEYNTNKANYGALVGVVESTDTQAVNNCHTIGGTVSSVNKHIGGLVGNLNSSTGGIYECSNQGTRVVGGSEANIIGGLVGNLLKANTGSIENCTNSGTVEGYGTLGGITGGLGSGTQIIGCSNSGFIHNVSLVADDSTIGEATRMAGGITSRSFNTAGGNIRNCYNKGEIKCAYVLGGITAMSSSYNSEITNCYNEGKLTLVKADFANHAVGGISAMMNYDDSKGSPTIKNCYSVGEISLPTGVNQARVGGIVGCANVSKPLDTSITTLVGLYSIEGRNVIGEVPSLFPAKTAVELKQQSTYEGWDFDNVWSIVEGTSYPTLRE